MTGELLESLVSLDQRLMLALNGWHTHWMDVVMSLASSVSFWVPLYLFLIYVIFRKYGWKKTLLWVGLIALCVILTDRVSSGLLKPLVGRLRPSNLHSPVVDHIYVLNGSRGKPYGFPSSHAANMAGITTFWILTARSRTISLCLVLWTLLVCWSRIYLGKHYPGDLLCGIILGMAIAAILAVLFRFLDRRLKTECAEM